MYVRSMFACLTVCLSVGEEEGRSEKIDGREGCGREVLFYYCLAYLTLVKDRDSQGRKAMLKNGRKRDQLKTCAIQQVQAHPLPAACFAFTGTGIDESIHGHSSMPTPYHR